MKKLLAIILAIASIFSLATFASADSATTDEVIITRGGVDYIFEAGTSDDVINSFIYSVEHEHEESDEAATYGLMCTLFGHKLETSTSSTITHKVYSTDPRCLKKIYAIEACTRCDYTSTRMISSEYISCC